MNQINKDIKYCIHNDNTTVYFNTWDDAYNHDVEWNPDKHSNKDDSMKRASEVIQEIES